MIDLAPDSFYLLDLFRVEGGTDHAYFLHSHFGRLRTDGLKLSPAEAYGHDTQMREFRRADQPAADTAPWSVTWEIEDRYRLRGDGAPVRLRYTDLTEGAERFLAEGWVSESPSFDVAEAWIPRVLVRRRATEGPLFTTFVGVIEPYEGEPRLSAARRLPLVGAAGGPVEDALAVEVRHGDGASDLLIGSGAEDQKPPLPGNGGVTVRQPEWNARLDGEMGWVRRDGGGAVCRLALCHGRELRVGDLTLILRAPADFVEIEIDERSARLVGGEAEVATLRRNGQELALDRPRQP
jgi:hypothetical protein